MNKLAIIAAAATLLSTQLHAQDTGPAIEKFRAAYETGQGLSYVVVKDDKGERIYRYGDAARAAAKKEKSGFMLFTCMLPLVLETDRASHRAIMAGAKFVHAGEPGFADLDARYVGGCSNPLVKSAVPPFAPATTKAPSAAVTAVPPSASVTPVTPSAPLQIGGTGAVTFTGRRVALSIGNASYRTVGALPNARKDAGDVAAALKAVGFAEVDVHFDLGLREMQKVLATFERKVAGAEWAVVYYGGHGIQVDGRNYLIPIDAELKTAVDVEDEALALDRVLARIVAASKLQLVILDACRDNPFKRAWVSTARAVGERGLARIEPAPHSNLFIAYAARDGQSALDGLPGANSPYARALVKYLSEPGLELGRFFRKVRDDVTRETGNRQQPFEYGSLANEDLYFRHATK